MYQLKKEEQLQINYVLEQMNRLPIPQKYKLEMDKEEKIMYELSTRMYDYFENCDMSTLEEILEYKKAEKERNLEFMKKVATNFCAYKSSWSWTNIYNCNIDYDIGYFTYCIQHAKEFANNEENQAMYIQAELAGYEMRKKSLLELIPLYEQLYLMQASTMLFIATSPGDFLKYCKQLLEEQEFLIESKNSQLNQQKQKTFASF